MKDNKKIIYVLLTILVILLISIPLYFLFTNKKSDSKKTEPTPTASKKIKKGEIQFSSEPFESKTKPNTKGMTEEEKEALEYTSAAFNYDEYEFGKPEKQKDGFYEVKLTERATNKTTNVFRVNIETGEQQLDIIRNVQKEPCPECEKPSE